MTVNPFVSGKF